MYEKLMKELRDAFKTATEANTNPYRFVPYYQKAASAIEELFKAAKAMHTWIFLNTDDEQAAYGECGLSDEMNAALGYCGAFEMLPESPKEET